VMDVWKLNDSRNYTGSVILQAGLAYDLRVDYFNDMLGGVIELFWERPDEKKPLVNFSDTPGTPITAQYFRQTAPPVASVLKPVITVPKAVTVAISKPVARPVAALPGPIPKPVVTVSTIKEPAVIAKPATATVTTPEPAKVTPANPLDGLLAGETVVLRQVQFTQSSYVLLPESSVELNKLVQAMTRNPQWRIEVAGHTDNVGDPRLNLALSENRAKVVAHYLVMRGIADDRIEAKGYGSTKPVADNSEEDGRSKNRRVEINIQ
jgi:outer membrane protein OmpA-like peptidoglycan-associated protein